ncbi:Hpt domain-containing protein [Teredinibacter turnerae]|uniref:Hpt domain-containing protein n=1 Tax=Teredinibacter turnerae TaxID=2426 RepID=UPI0004161546|nr:Hpt domain-containing protein [Teredinibacter turnerae]
MNDELCPPSLFKEAQHLLTDAGFDVGAGVDRLRGNESKLLRLVKMFCESYMQAGEEIERLYKQGDLTNLQRLTHQIKGTAANVGAMAISRLAASIETPIKLGGKEVDEEALAALLDKLTDLRALHTALSDLECQLTGVCENGTLTKDDFLRELSVIKIELEADVASAMDMVERLKVSAKGTEYETESAKVDTMLMSFQLDELNEYIDNLLEAK